MKNRVTYIGVLAILVFTTSSCSNSNVNEAFYFAEKACLSKNDSDALKFFSKARQLDSNWERAANASVEKVVYKNEISFLLQYLSENDPQFRDAKQKFDKANLIVASECLALTQE